ncbi:MAG: hypothetical protein M3R44_01670 [Candidatus Eremiobacteraeota bacterium]|nr:hypothetical protein [Candidatus Eremiobacteraeota bacterium]
MNPLEVLERQVVHALRIHQAWRETLRAIANRLPQKAAVVPEAECELHLWLTVQVDTSFRRLPLYERTREAHGQFHRSIERLRGEVHAPGTDASFDAAAAREAAAWATTLKGCLEEWLTLARRR